MTSVKATRRACRPLAEALESRNLLTAIVATLTATGTTLDLPAGKAVRSEVASFTTTDLKENASDFAATISWSDGATSKGVIVAEGRGTGDYAVMGGHAYSKANVPGQTATVVIRDTQIDSTDSDTATTNVNLSGTAITNVVAMPIQAMAASPVKDVVVGTFRADYRNAKASDFFVSPDWEDGTGNGEATILPVAGSPGEFEVEVTHVFPEATGVGDPIGPSSVNMVITDTAFPFVGGYPFRFQITAPVSIADPPLVAAGNPTTFAATAGQSTGEVDLGNFVDVNPNGDASNLLVSVDWGDHSPDSSFTGIGNATDYVEGTPNSFQVVSQHAYATAGSYPVTVTIDDGNGGSTLVLHSTAVVAAPV